MPTRREFLKTSGRWSGALALSGYAVDSRAEESAGVEVNDVQSQLNATRVRRIVQPTSIDAIQAALANARNEGRAVSVAGGRHAMGGQQFGQDMLLLDMKKFNRVVAFDRAKGQIEVEAGIEWPELIDYLIREQAGSRQPWAIREKQSGVDRVSLGGSLASNVHGRGLAFPPIVAWRGSGYFSISRPRSGNALCVFSYVYFASMVLRYVATMGLHPERRWFGGTIPIFFHFVLAAYVFLLGRYQLSAGRQPLVDRSASLSART